MIQVLNNIRFRPLLVSTVVVLLSSIVLVSELSARTLLKNICRVKGQEENTLNGLGLVVGLKGTGDGGDNLPTMRALAQAMAVMKNPIGGANLKGGGGLAELKNVKNVALVWVSATVPASGARSGDKIDCSVSSISAKSLAGGRLAFAALQGPNVKDDTIYALAEGRIHLDSNETPTEGKVHSGCRLEQDIFNAFHIDGKLTLVLDKNHADFQIASAVSEAINSQLGFGRGAESSDEALANAIDSANIVVTIPNQYRAVPVEFVAQIMELHIFELNTEARVVINRRSGSIVISGDIEIGAVVVSHKNIVVESDGTESKFLPVDPGQTSAPKLKSLVEALNAVKVPVSDIIEIIKGIDRNGNLHGRLIIE